MWGLRLPSYRRILPKLRGSPNAGAGPAPAPVMPAVPVAVAPFALPGTEVPAAVARCPCCDGPPHKQWSNDDAIPGGFAFGDKVVSLTDHDGGKCRWETSKGSIGTVIGAGTCLRRGPCIPGYTCHAMGRVMHEGVMCQLPNTPEYRPMTPNMVRYARTKSTWSGSCRSNRHGAL